VILPDGCKDANQCLMDHGVEVLFDCLDNPVPYPVEGVYYMADVELQRYYESGDEEGVSIGYKNLDPIFKLEKDVGQLITVTGIPGHGKSEFVDQIIINTAQSHGWKWGIFSPENFPLEYHGSKLAEKLIGKPFKSGYTGQDGQFVNYHNRMTKVELQEAQAWLHDHVYAVLPPEDDISIDSILMILKSLVFVHGIRGAVIDPWNEINSIRERAGASETDWISVELTKLRRFARNHSVTIFT
jgi:twinkle protein